MSRVSVLLAVALLAAFSLGWSGSAAAAPPSGLGVKRAIPAADTIFVGDVVSVTPAGESTYTPEDFVNRFRVGPRPTRQYTVRAFEARLKVQSVLKGRVPGEEAAVRFAREADVDLAGWFDSVAQGDRCIVFLRTITPGTYEFADAGYGKLLVSAGQPDLLPSDTPESAVEKVLIASLAGPDPQVVVGCIRQLPEVGGDAARDALWKLVQQKEGKDRAVRGYALASLLQLDYVPAGEEAVEYLKEPTWSRRVEGAKGRILQGFRETRNPAFVPQLRLLSTPDDPRARENAVYALREMRDPSNIPWLVQALDDSSPEVRYQAMMGLAETVGRAEPGWAIGVDGFAERGDELIAKWKQWWREEGMKEYGAPEALAPRGTATGEDR